MSMNDDVQLDASRIRIRGRGTMAAIGVGGLGLIGAIVYFFLTGQVPDSPVTSGRQPVGNQTLLIETCKTDEGTDKNTECWVVTTAGPLGTYWDGALPSAAGTAYKGPDLVLFPGSTSMACGTASSQTGPFYCPADKAVYLDIDFFKEPQSQYGAANSRLIQAYTVTHEFGHSIQDQTGVLSEVNHKGIDPSDSLVHPELQADYLTGMWLYNASRTVNPESGREFLIPPTRGELKTTIDATTAVDDNHIYKSADMEANQKSFTHGSSAKRTEWLMKRYKSGKFESCDTWSAPAP